jgi:hypothetical protein
MCLGSWRGVSCRGGADDPLDGEEPAGATISAGFTPARPRRRNRLGRRFLPVLTGVLAGLPVAAPAAKVADVCGIETGACFDFPRLRRRARFFELLSKRPSWESDWLSCLCGAESPCGPAPFLAVFTVPFGTLPPPDAPLFGAFHAPDSGSFKIVSFERRANHQGRSQDAL